MANLRQQVKFHAEHDRGYRLQLDIRRVHRKGRLPTRRDRIHGQRFPVWRYTLEFTRCQLVSQN